MRSALYRVVGAGGCLGRGSPPYDGLREVGLTLYTSAVYSYSSLASRRVVESYGVDAVSGLGGLGRASILTAASLPTAFV